MVDEGTLLSTTCGSIVAPAGCGKTELIARAAKAADGEQLLVLTHTNAGVRAIRDRLKRLGVNRHPLRLDTVAGWALRYAVAFPKGSRLSSPQPVDDEWDEVYDGVRDLLSIEAIRAIIRASYTRLLVDEYQDCTRKQHDLVLMLAGILPTCILGDPLQGIFDFAGASVPWSEVEDSFPSLGELSEPWRWKGRNEELGRWCLELRAALLRGDSIHLENAPLQWHKIENTNQTREAHRVANLMGPVVAIRKWAPQAHEFARRLGGRYRSMEEIEGKELRSFAEDLDELTGPMRAARVAAFAKDCMTGVGDAIPSVIKSFEAGKRPDLGRLKKHPEIAAALVAVCDAPSTGHVREAMRQLATIPDSHIFRPDLWREATKVLLEHERGLHPTLKETALTVRHRQRAIGRSLDPRVVSRTLLVKGLEFDHAIIPAAEEFEDARRPGDGARHFYVAATRGSKTLTVLSRSNVLRFSATAIR